VATCTIESASATNDTISIRLTNDVSDVSVDMIHVTGGETPGSYACEGPDLTYGNVSEINSTTCTGLSIAPNDALRITGTKNLWCTATAR
ncbi:MAG: hypothetical protein JXA43_02960, partial [Candidatus Diapherotrites archaeon]|nr:hypothetical protein [Candidatus Diapherotrites archaeon]